jgi:hypothetical protein
MFINHPFDLWASLGYPENGAAGFAGDAVEACGAVTGRSWYWDSARHRKL